ARAVGRDGAWSRVMDADLLPLLRMSEKRRGQSPWLLVGMIWSLAVLALAGPAWSHLETPAFRSQSAWVLVLYLSPSMAATDTGPNRATRARYAAADLLASAHDARVGLVAFAGEPHTVAPLTTDVATIRLLLRPLAPSLMPEAGDKLAPALDEAERLLQASYAKNGHVIVFSDGFGDPAEALLAAQRLRQSGTTVSVVGVGTEAGAPEPNGKGGFVAAPDGRPRLTRIQTGELRQLATAGGGKFVSVGMLPDLLSTLEADRPDAIDPHADAEPSHASLTQWRNEGVWLLPLLLLLGALVARRGWL
ncbi:MAG TPA: VWA domain-containing protein, partial [Steroidobacteraceae bacterium]